MKSVIRILIVGLLLLTTLSFKANAQSFSLTINITNQLENPVLFGWISGDEFHSIDSALVDNNIVKFHFPANAHPGVYRLVFGKTGYARVMNDAPQQLDFIFNKENIELQTDFKAPLESLKVLQSVENELYFNFKQRLTEFERAVLLLEKQVDQLWLRKDTAGAIEMADEFNRLQMEWDLRLVQIVQQNKNTFAALLIETDRQSLKDGFLSPEERKETLKKEFFNNLSFNEEALIYSSAYTDKVFEYLLLFNQPGFTRNQRIAAYKNAVDTIHKNCKENTTVHQFIFNYLKHGFEVLQMPELMQYLETLN